MLEFFDFRTGIFGSSNKENTRITRDREKEKKKGMEGKQRYSANYLRSIAIVQNQYMERERERERSIIECLSTDLFCVSGFSTGWQ